MPTITLGSGKDYDTDAAVKNVWGDFTNMAGQGIVYLDTYPDYTYDTGIISNKSGVDINNKFVLRAAPGYEHRGMFTSPVTMRLSYAGAINNPARGFTLGDGYHEFRDIHLIYDGTVNYRGSVFRMTGGQGHIFKNILVTVLSGANPKDSCPYLQEDSASNAISLNCICVNVLGSYAINPISLNASSTAKFFNCLFADYNGFNCGTAPITIYNTGTVLTVADNNGFCDFTNYANAVGSHNYNNGGSGVGPGTSFLKSTRSEMGFLDLANKNFKLSLSSVLIGSGVYRSENPTNIDNQIWLGNHRSPFENTIIRDSYFVRPNDCTKLQGPYSDNVLFSIPFDGNTLDNQGQYKERISTGGYNDIYPQDGMFGSYVYNKYGLSTTFKYLDPGISGKKQLGFTFLFKKVDGALGIAENRFLISNTAETWGIKFYGATNTITFKIGSILCTVSLSGLVDVLKWFTFHIEVNLLASSNAERVKIWTYCCGYLKQQTVTFSGEITDTYFPSTQLLTVGNSPGRYGSFFVTERPLGFQEKFELMDDPFLIWRDAQNIEELVALKYIHGELGMWRYKSQLFGPSTTMTGTSTMVA